MRLALGDTVLALDIVAQALKTIYNLACKAASTPGLSKYCIVHVAAGT